MAHSGKNNARQRPDPSEVKTIEHELNKIGVNLKNGDLARYLQVSQDGFKRLRRLLDLASQGRTINWDGVAMQIDKVIAVKNLSEYLKKKGPEIQRNLTSLGFERLNEFEKILGQSALLSVIVECKRKRISRVDCAKAILTMERKEFLSLTVMGPRRAIEMVEAGVKRFKQDCYRLISPQEKEVRQQDLDRFKSTFTKSVDSRGQKTAENSILERVTAEMLFLEWIAEVDQELEQLLEAKGLSLAEVLSRMEPSDQQLLVNTLGRERVEKSKDDAEITKCRDIVETWLNNYKVEKSAHEAAISPHADRGAPSLSAKAIGGGSNKDLSEYLKQKGPEIQRKLTNLGFKRLNKFEEILGHPALLSVIDECKQQGISRVDCAKAILTMKPEEFLTLKAMDPSRRAIEMVEAGVKRFEQDCYRGISPKEREARQEDLNRFKSTFTKSVESNGGGQKTAENSILERVTAETIFLEWIEEVDQELGQLLEAKRLSLAEVLSRMEPSDQQLLVNTLGRLRDEKSKDAREVTECQKIVETWLNNYKIEESAHEAASSPHADRGAPPLSAKAIGGGSKQVASPKFSHENPSDGPQDKNNDAGPAASSGKEKNAGPAARA